MDILTSGLDMMFVLKDNLTDSTVLNTEEMGDSDVKNWLTSFELTREIFLAAMGPEVDFRESSNLLYRYLEPR